MNPMQTQLVQQSFETVLATQAHAAELFFGKLFEFDPFLQTMFKGDMVEQGKKFMQMMARFVRDLDNAANVMPAIKELSARHIGYGVTDDQYDTVGAALL